MNNILPYGDTPNDGKIQLSFTLPVNSDEKGKEAAKILLKNMGLFDINIAHSRYLDNGFTFFICYGSTKNVIDMDSIKVTSPVDDIMSMEEVSQYIKEYIGRKLICIGASTGTDAHTVGIDAIMNMKGFAGHYGLERYEMIEAHNMGSQVPNEVFIQRAKEIKADVLLVSQTVTQKNIHLDNLTELVDMLEAEGIRKDIILICGGARISNELAKELGYDAGFGQGNFAEHVASFMVREYVSRKMAIPFSTRYLPI